MFTGSDRYRYQGIVLYFRDYVAGSMLEPIMRQRIQEKVQVWSGKAQAQMFSLSCL